MAQNAVDKTSKSYTRAIGVAMLGLGILSLWLYPAVVRLLTATHLLTAAKAAKPTLGFDNTHFLLFYLLIYVIAMGLPSVLAHRCSRCNITPRSLRDRVPPMLGIACVIAGVVMCIGFGEVASFCELLYKKAGITPAPTPMWLEDTPRSLALNILVMAAAPAYLEEKLFRGYVLVGLRPLGDTFAVVVSSLLFGLMHGNLTQIPFAFMMGLVLGFLTVRLKSLKVAYAIHFCNNLLTLLLTQWLPYRVSDAVSYAVLTQKILLGLAVLGLFTLLRLVRWHPPVLFARTPRTGMAFWPRIRQCFLTPAMPVAIGLFIYKTVQTLG